MIELATEDRFLARFADELAGASRMPACAASHGAEDREAARLAWAMRIVDEYRSVAVFAELLQRLTDLEAPFPALCTVHRLIGDELRHTQLTIDVVEALGGCADLAIDLAAVALPPLAPGETPAVRALRIVAREVVVVEEESIYALAAYRDATTEPAIRGVLEQLLADEVRHAAAGRALLQLFEHGPLAAATAGLRTELSAQLAADRAEQRALYLASAVGGPGRALGASIERGDLERIWARLTPSRSRRTAAVARADTPEAPASR